MSAQPPPEEPDPPHEAATWKRRGRKEQPLVQHVTVNQRRGCSICGCGCIIPAILIPILTLALWGALGITAIVLSIAASFGSLHAISVLGRSRDPV